MKKNVYQIIAGIIFIVLGLIILFIIKPWDLKKCTTNTNEKSFEKIVNTSISENNVDNSIKIESDEHINVEREDISVTFIESVFNVGYRSLLTDKSSYINNISNISTPDAYLMYNPDTNLPYEFDEQEGNYERNDLSELLANWIISNEVETKAEFKPESETIIADGYLYYVKGTLSITFYSCKDLSNFATYFQIDNMKLNTTYEIPVEVEIVKDYFNGYKVGQVFRQYEFDELYN